MVDTLRKNPFEKIYYKCNQGDPKLKNQNIPDFPRLIDIELTNHCNFHCLMCPTGTLSHRRDIGYMADEVFEKILNEISVYKTPVRFIRWGEPTLHRSLLKFIKKLKDYEILCHINTNGSVLDEIFIEKLIENGLDSIKFSFQGVNAQSYDEMRNIDFFDELINVIKLFYQVRGDRSYPYIHVSTTVTYENCAVISAFKQQIRDYCDSVTVGRTVMEHIDINKINVGKKEKEMIIKLKKEESVVKKHPNCPEVFDKLSINWDGTVSACCGDYDNFMIVGDIKTDTLKNIWKSEKFKNYRNLIANNKHECIELCRTCYDYQGLQTPGLQKTG